jgi:hypothetical protein
MGPSPKGKWGDRFEKCFGVRALVSQKDFEENFRKIPPANPKAVHFGAKWQGRNAFAPVNLPRLT